MRSLFIDSFRYIGRSDFYSVLLLFLNTPGFRFICIKRFCEKFPSWNMIGFLCRYWFKIMQRKYGFQIPHKVIIGPGLFLGHFGGIVINQSVIIGSNCNIAQGVTIGYVSRGKKKGSPVIGDRVWIGANAVIVGNIKIGNDVLIAPLTFLNFDVPDYSVVVGNPARIVGTNGSEGYVNRQISV